MKEFPSEILQTENQDSSEKYEQQEELIKEETSVKIGRHALKTDIAKEASYTEAIETKNMAPDIQVAVGALEHRKSPRKIEFSESRISELEELLSNGEKVKKCFINYLEQYKDPSPAGAKHLHDKSDLDDYILDKLSGENASEFVKSEAYKNYFELAFVIATLNKMTVGENDYFPDFVTNPVLANPDLRKMSIDALGKDEDKAKEMELTAAKGHSEYVEKIANINEAFESYDSISQGDLDLCGDYLYTTRDFDTKLAKNFACFLFNDAKKQPELKSSTPILGALANYFAHQDTLDERIADSRVYIANFYGLDSDIKNDEIEDAGESTPDYVLLKQFSLRDISLQSDESLSRSRNHAKNDLYSLMFVTYHELTHDYQRLMFRDNNPNSSGMAHVVSALLRINLGGRFPLLDSESKPILDKNGEPVMTDYYCTNHDSDEIEIQADEESWRQCRKFIREHEVHHNNNQDEEASTIARKHIALCQSNVREVNARRAFALKVDENGEMVSNFEFDIQRLRKIISDDPTLIDSVPQLNVYFDKSGNIKPNLLFDKEIANVSYTGFDSVTDNFGVEIGTCAINDEECKESILSYVSEKELSDDQVLCCVTNLWNILHQNALKTRPLSDVDFDNYIDTNTYGQHMSKDEIRMLFLKSYLIQLESCMAISQRLKERYPHLSNIIEHEEKDYYCSYYQELTKGLDVKQELLDKIKEMYSNSPNQVLSDFSKTIVRL